MVCESLCVCMRVCMSVCECVCLVAKERERAERLQAWFVCVCVCVSVSDVCVSLCA